MLHAFIKICTKQYEFSLVSDTLKGYSYIFTLFFIPGRPFSTVKMSPPVLYSASISPPCRGVLLATGAADIEVQVEEIKLQRGEHRKKEFLKVMRPWRFFLFRGLI